ncbi:hypothetical protein GcM3_012013 [Golovinomyces cichoracearum]|uniref:LsmAD domain-containing protein n=1 Tax=Golovinomyces cichoracearum TaxID=62708 RepID=A0A420J9T5_9PEZI|nr:hypothetical protein GcM3_012013 [Golovinomyces cichoracearum]
MVQGKKINEMTSSSSKYQQPSMPPQRKDISLNGNKIEGRQSGKLNSFRTDTAISSGRFKGERTLERWVSDVPVDIDGTLDSSLNKSGGTWDQFAENKRLFGLTTDYNENFYTTTIDKSHPQYKQRIAEADRKAREIERSTTTNSHVAEERILNNVIGTNSKLDEEDKYCGVQRQQNPPSLSNPTSNKYLPPAKRAAAGQISNSCTPTGPAMIHPLTSRSQKSNNNEGEVSAKIQNENSKPFKADNLVMLPSSKLNINPGAKASLTPASSNRKLSPHIKNEGLPNATATVERDVASAFKNFASQQRKNVDQIRITRAKNDKEVKLNDLKAFANNFKLNTPVPSDLVPIIARDPKKQKEIQAKAQRNAEEAVVIQANSLEITKTTSPPSEAGSNRPTSLSHVSSSSSNVTSRQNSSRNINSPQNSMRGPLHLNSNIQQALGNRSKGLDQAKSSQLSQAQASKNDSRNSLPATSSCIDAGSARSNLTQNSNGARLNPNSIEFRPSYHAASLNPGLMSSPRSVVTGAIPVPRARSVLRRKPIPPSERPSIAGQFDTLNFIKTMAPPTGKEVAWKATGGLRPAYDTQPIWKQATVEDKPDCPIRLTYNQLFESIPFSAPSLSPNQTHTLPYHLQQQHQTIHLPHPVLSLGVRQSPHQIPVGLYGNAQGSTPIYNVGTPDEHRMITSHSAQSFASPRLQNISMNYPSPINQNAQITYNPQMVHYSNIPQAQSGYRSLSNTHQFLPQQNPISQMMIPSSAGTFATSQGAGPNPQMMFQGTQPPPFMHAANGHSPLLTGVNGYPSPGRAAPTMINQGSQQGPHQSVYGINPGISTGPNYGSPIFSQQPPIQLPFRPYSGPNNQPHGPNSQPLHPYGSQGRRNNQNNINLHSVKSFQRSHTQNNTTNNQVPVITQIRNVEGSEEAK